VEIKEAKAIADVLSILEDIEGCIDALEDMPDCIAIGLVIHDEYKETGRVFMPASDKDEAIEMLQKLLKKYKKKISDIPSGT
jgi:hypothetical protein